MSETTLVMAGRVEEFRLEDILQAVGSSAQCTAIELRHEGREVHGRIWIQAGRVLDAEHAGERGRSAFYSLFTPAVGDVFEVQRVKAAPICEPLGSVSMLLLEAHERAGLAQGSGVSPIPETLPLEKVAGGASVVAIASMRGGVGRSTVAAQLGAALARQGHQVLLIDADNSGDAATLAGARPSVARPLEDLLDGADAIGEALVESGQPRLRLLAVQPPHGRHSNIAEWEELLARARMRADIVLVDTPSGTGGLAGDVIACSTHVVGVIRSDRGAATAATALEERTGAALIGVVVNLFDGRSPPSVEAFQKIATCGAPLFETTVPRADALAGDGAAAPEPIAWLFDALADEVAARIGLIEVDDDPSISITVS